MTLLFRPFLHRVMPWYGALILATTLLLPAEVAYHFQWDGVADQATHRSIYIVVVVLLYAWLSGPRWTIALSRAARPEATPPWKHGVAAIVVLIHLLIAFGNRIQPAHLSWDSAALALGTLAALWLLAAASFFVRPA